MFKKILSVALSVALIVCVMPMGAVSVLAEVSGDYAYTVANGEATVTSYTGWGGDIVIPSTLGGYPVRGIGVCAFEECDTLTSVVIPEGVTSIGERAFYSCDNLGMVSLPDSVTQIGYSAFSSCSILDGVEFPDGLQTIDGYAFERSGLTSLWIPASVTTIGDGAFADCADTLASITVANGNTVYRSVDNCLIDIAGKKLVAGCSNSVIPSDGSVTKIGPSAFAYYTGAELVIPEGVTEIERWALSYGAMTSVTLPESLKTIGAYAFFVNNSLIDIWYNGTESDKENISIGVENRGLNSAVWHYHDEVTEPDEDCPIVSFTMDPKVFIEHTNGGWGTDSIYDENGYVGETPEYYWYDYHPYGIAYILKDGTVWTDWYSLEWNGNTYYLDWQVDQSYENQWTAGNTYTVHASIAGFDFSYDIEIVEKEEPDDPVIDENAPMLVVDDVMVKAGETFTVAIRTQNNTGIVSLKLSVGYDGDVLELVSSKWQDFTGGVSGTSPLTSNPFVLNWANTLSGNNDTDGTFAYLTFKVKDGAAIGDTAITLNYDPDDVYDENYENITFATVDGTVSVVEYVDIAVTDLPTKLNYLEAKDAFDPAGGKVTVTYSNGVTEVIDLTADMVSGFDNTRVGKQTVTVTYEGLTATFDVEILAKTLTSMVLTAKPSVNEYLEAFDTLTVDGGKVTLYYDNGTSEEIDLTVDMVSGFDNTLVGKQTLTVTYEGFADTYDVEILAKSLTSVAVTTNPQKTVYLEGVGTVSVTGGKVTLYYNNRTSEVIDLTADMVSGFDNTIVGEQHVTVTYETLTATFPVVVLSKDSPYFEVENVTAKAGETVTVAIRTKNNTGIVSLKLLVGYDRDVLELVTSAWQDFTGGVTGTSPVTDNPFIINWTNTLNGNNDTDGVVALLTFKVKEGAAIGETAITVQYNPDDVYDQNYTNVMFATVDGAVNVIEYISGDVNGDAKINNKDLGLLLQYLNNWQVEVEELACDVNRDGKINNKDLGILLQYLNNWDVELK